jgi:transcriptional regulator with XRE-family HTH domain
MREFVCNLQIMMERRGINQKDLAIGSGISEAAISRYCAGTQVPKGPAIVSMARVLGCHVEELSGE